MAYRSCGSSRRLMYPPDLDVGGIRLAGPVRIAPGFRCTGVASVASVPARRPATRVVYRHAEPILLVGLAIPSAAIDWRIAQTWSWPAALIALWLGATALAVGAAIFRGRLRALGAAPWGETFASPALHHLVTWPGQFLWPLPLQLAARPLGWWDERIFLLVAAGLIWWLLSRLFPGAPGRLAATAFFLIPGHSLVAVLGDNDLPMLALLLAALLAADRRRYLLMGLLLGLAVVTKQHAVLAVPLVATWAVVRGADFRGMIRAAGVAAIVGVAVVAP